MTLADDTVCNRLVERMRTITSAVNTDSEDGEEDVDEDGDDDQCC